MGKTPKIPGPPPEPSEPPSEASWGPVLDLLLSDIAVRFPDIRRSDARLKGEPALICSPEQVLELAHYLKGNDFCSFNYCRSVTGIDKIDRYEVVYNLARLPQPGSDPSFGFATIAIIVSVSKENPQTPSLVKIWQGVEFQEREIFDMFGVIFEGHPDLRRILLDEAFQGHPLRKTYPLVGEWQDMVALDAHLDENQVRTLKENAGLPFEPEDVPPNFRR